MAVHKRDAHGGAAGAGGVSGVLAADVTRLSARRVLQVLHQGLDDRRLCGPYGVAAEDAQRRRRWRRRRVARRWLVLSASTYSGQQSTRQLEHAAARESLQDV
ncbi:uncharacterized protein LOC133350866 isoform X2 [Lethenteron reissneri]|uniref:uncharacterized protein LOC133350866 isoform X2 n=1 Tax=Lethenteron reissneri TaxID=7753 RepID=UPI002AB6D6C2|nr:uncharacterized protein LOC133350866 isoform X2 [Lethenteron reissneri]